MTPQDVAGPPPGRWPFWRTLGWGIVIMILSTLIEWLMFFAFAVVDLYDRHYLSNLSLPYLLKVWGYEGRRGDVIFSTVIISNLICVAATLQIVLLKGHPLRDYLSLYPVRPAVLLKWIGIAAVVVILLELAAVVFHIDFGTAGMKWLFKTTKPVWLFWVAAVLVAPLFEEVLFRGFLFRGFQSSFIGTTGAVMLTSILWAALHIQYNLYGMGFIACTGVLFGIARVQTGSLLVPLTLHATLNFTDMIFYTVSGA
jgi:membrane protease YdiL (CAAX protease family)